MFTPHNRHRTALVGAGALALLLALAGCDRRPQQESPPMSSQFRHDGNLTFEKPDGSPVTTIEIEIADNDEKRTAGLMGRPTLAEDRGMLFIFEEEHPLGFWMMNTMVSLDMIFLNARKEVITIQRNTIPFSTDTYSSSKDGMYVVEVNAGFCDKYGIEEGYKIDWERGTK